MGLSKDVSADISLTIAGTVSCSPPYASPEQGRGESDLDCRTDTYSLGVTFFQMLTGELPFQAKSPGGFIIKHATEPPPTPRRFKPRISPGTANLVLQMLRKIPSQRPTPAKVVEILRDFLMKKKRKASS